MFGTWSVNMNYGNKLNPTLIFISKEIRIGIFVLDSSRIIYSILFLVFNIAS